MNNERFGCFLLVIQIQKLMLLYTTKYYVSSEEIQTNCDITRYSNNYGDKNGTIHSPSWPDSYGNNLRCVYRLIALPHERVELRFTEFEIKGVPPRCSHDYVDVYTQAREPFADLLDLPLHGRYCGANRDLLPDLLISMHNVFIIGFYSDNQKEERGFFAEYRFIDGSLYSVGTPAPHNVCGQTVLGGVKPRGVLLSPTYPGIYPDNVNCFYRLQGTSGQRIKLVFLDMDLYSGGEHCPFDYVRAYDGRDTQASLIGTYCGHTFNGSIYSTKENIFLEFITKSGRVEPTRSSTAHSLQLPNNETLKGVHRRGFKAEFSISSSYVNLNFIKGQHVRGTECDQLVLSGGESAGFITSPNYPHNYPLNVTCFYYIDGLVDTQNLEKTKLIFEAFDIPTVRTRCDNGQLIAYIHGQDLSLTTPDKIPPDRALCGQALPEVLLTSHPRLLLIFNTTGAKYSGKGFMARYQFLTDYAIPGTPATTDARCHFIYRSSSSNHGTFNSPRNPSHYPDNSSCIYEFYGSSNQRIRITFESFKVENDNGDTDYVQVYNIGPALSMFKHNGVSHNSSNDTRTLVGHYCGEQLPGPQLSEDSSHITKLAFVSNEQGIQTGFRAKYEFIEKMHFTSKSTRCFYNITSGISGLINSPNSPHKYLINSTCDWYIYARAPTSRISLYFEMFTMEGHMEKVGCGNAVLRIYANDSSLATHELCGIQGIGSEILSQGHFMRLRFISAARAVGAKGFKLIWTEVFSVEPPASDTRLLGASIATCPGFRCRRSGYCIDASLRCNKIPNCGSEDFSDEAVHECGTYRDHGLLNIILGVVVALVCLIFIIVCVLHRRRRTRRRRWEDKYKDPEDQEVRYVTRTGPNTHCPASRGRSDQPHRSADGRGASHTSPACRDTPVKEKTQKVSIV